MGGIWGRQVGVVEARWVGWQKRPESNGPLRCFGTGPGTGGTRSRVGAAPLLPRSPSKENKEVEK